MRRAIEDDPGSIRSFDQLNSSGAGSVRGLESIRVILVGIEFVFSGDENIQSFYNVCNAE